MTTTPSAHGFDLYLFLFFAEFEVESEVRGNEHRQHPGGHSPRVQPRPENGGQQILALLPKNSLNLVSHTVSALMLLVCVYLRRVITRMRGLNADNHRELELTSNCTIPEFTLRGQGFIGGGGRASAVLGGSGSSSEAGSNYSASPASSTLPLPDFHRQRHKHSHVNRSYTNTYSSCGSRSFTMPSIIGNDDRKSRP